MRRTTSVTDKETERPPDHFACDTYIHTEHPAQFQHYLAGRNSGVQGSFLLPHLRPGMRLLDCGCRGETISIGLAAVVAPSEVVGIDLGAAQVDSARSLASRQGGA